MSAVTKRLAGRLALITGASRGIGAAVARRFAAEGAHVILVARTVGALEERDDEIRALGGTATLVPLDLRDFDKIDQMGASLYQRFGKLDVLVGNAGVLGVLSPVGHFDPQTWSQVIDTNLTANWRLIRSLDPLLRQSPAGRAVFTTCAAGRETRPYWGAYAASKAALETLVRIYAGEVANTSLRVNLIDPGVVATKLRLQGFPAEDRAALNKPDDVVEPFVALASAECTLNGEALRL
ncbi:MAG TPA: SDR family NAD(P)-dependent oxidoreductase [Stellaceae bacterium]|jgi:NAD(P)-dependent dehydrogenase (short-subunit alcohol dehydrogenase family)|nr:SDR family NAD(P)-dependent oxidoreductase [Stellaceae bacterium]